MTNPRRRKRNKSALLIVLLVHLFFINSALAEAGCFLVNDFPQAWNCGLGLVSTPLRFERKDWIRLGLTAGGTALLFTVDKHIQKLALKNQNPFNDVIFNVDKIHGNEYSLYLAGSVYTLGLITKKPAIRTAGLNAVEAYMFSGAITGVGKVLFGRKRPYASASPVLFSPFHMTDNRYHSLPSGHTTVSFVA